MTQVPSGTVEAVSFVPYGTSIINWPSFPSAKALGYFLLSFPSATWERGTGLVVERGSVRFGKADVPPLIFLPF